MNDLQSIARRTFSGAPPPAVEEQAIEEKNQLLYKSGILEFCHSSQTFKDIGGLAQLLAWFNARMPNIFGGARFERLPKPKGVLLVGMRGCGKNLTTRAVASEWGVPLLRLDVGRIFGPVIEPYESMLRRVTQIAEAASPCILWIDEIEKGFAGFRGNQGDSGVSARVFGTLLTWMEENKAQVFTIATANDIEGLPPELLRKGRFDEIFFIDLPSPLERANILAIHLAKHQRDFREFNLAGHVAATNNFSGAELEQVVVAALYEAFAEGEDTKLEDRHLERAIASTVPLSQSMGDKITRLRVEARDKWRAAAGETNSEGKSGQAAVVEPPPVAKKPKRVFEV